MSDLTRRNFIAAGAAVAAPMILGAQSKSGAKLPIMGDGEFKYEATHDWGLASLPSTHKLGNCHSVVQDRNGHIYVHHTVHATSQSPDSVIEYDDKGKFIRSWGAMFRGGAHGMHYSVEGRNEYLYFCSEKNGIVTKRTLKGEEVWTMGYPQLSPVYQKGPGSTGPGGAAGLNYRPTNLALDPTSLDFWIGDGYGSFYMFHYTQKKGYPELVKTFGGPVPAPAGAGDAKGKGGPGAAKGGPAPADQAKGAAPDQAKGGGQGKGKGGPPPPPPPLTSTNNPHGNWIDTRNPNSPVLLIADRGNRRILRYTLNDEPIDAVDLNGGQPCHFDQRNDLILVPYLNSMVGIMKGNEVVTKFGAPPQPNPNTLRQTQNRTEFPAGAFVAPHGACFDRNGDIFVAEWVEIGRVSKLRRIG